MNHLQGLKAAFENPKMQRVIHAVDALPTPRAVFQELSTALADPSGQRVWSENAVNLVLIGVAWVAADSLARAKQTWWQILPLGPAGAGDSPYQCYSAFAGNPLLVSPDDLVTDGLLKRADLPGNELPPGSARELPLPASLTLGKKVVRVLVVEDSVPPPGALHSLAEVSVPPIAPPAALEPMVEDA